MFHFSLFVAATFIKIVHFLRLLVPLRTWLDKSEVNITNHHHLKLEI